LFVCHLFFPSPNIWFVISREESKLFIVHSAFGLPVKKLRHRFARLTFDVGFR
jgi:hypothetical protein